MDSDDEGFVHKSVTVDCSEWETLKMEKCGGLKVMEFYLIDYVQYG